ncbi:MAG: carbohydrate ABC transporter permease [Lachnospiraceae bacterium]|jgi:raffinose/stachyose/melibiose transport system permease protein|nr:carbohydrate ABC transporter permease [Lachnospiraceae bacterium]
MTKKSKFSIGQSIVYLLLILWSITTVYPIIWVLQNSFKAKDKILANSFSLPLGELFTMANYRKAFTNLNIVSAYKNSIFISTMVALFVILLAGMAAYALSRYKFFGSEVLHSLVIAGMMFPVFATIVPVFAMEFSWGIASTSNWLLTMLSVILPQVAGNLSFAMVVLIGYIKGLPIELEEAAYMEGCNAFQIYFKVVLPLTKPSFATVAIFSFLWSYNDLFTQTFFLKRPDMYGITTLLNQLTAKEGTNYGLMASAVTLVIVPVIIVYCFLQKYIIKGMTAGAVKG